MKRLAIEYLEKNLAAFVKTVPKEKILLTRNGQPFAMVSDASAFDWEDIGYMNDPSFWKMIAERRKDKATVPLEQIKAELLQREKAEVAARKTHKKVRNKRDRSAA